MVFENNLTVITNYTKCRLHYTEKCVIALGKHVFFCLSEYKESNLKIGRDTRHHIHSNIGWNFLNAMTYNGCLSTGMSVKQLRTFL